MTALVLLLVTTSSSVSSVVVFPDRAQVNRVAKIECGSRVATMFQHIPLSAEADSFRARMTGGTVDGLRVERVDRVPQASEQLVELGHRLEALDQEIIALKDDLIRAEHQERLANGLTEISTAGVAREMTLGQPDIKAWATAFDSSLAALMTYAKTAAELKSKIRLASLRREQIQREQEETRVAQTAKEWAVEVLATCPPGASAELYLSYVVGGAGWKPSYEARADERGGSVSFSTWATVHQATGEDWPDVQLILSTAVPTQNATPPDLRVLTLSAREPLEAKKVLVRRNEAYRHAETARSQIADGLDKTIASNQGLSVQLTVPKRSSVLGNDKSVRIFVGKTQLQAQFGLRATPRALPVAFRIATLANQGAWPLLPGHVDAFRSTGLVARYALEHVPVGGGFTLTFGIEDTVRVKRTVIDEIKRDSGLFNNKQRFIYAYTFEVTNYGKSELPVTLAEITPVSELEDVTVSFDQQTTAGYRLDPKDGLVQWGVQLKPGEKKKLNLRYFVDVPRSYDTRGM